MYIYTHYILLHQDLLLFRYTYVNHHFGRIFLNLWCLKQIQVKICLKFCQCRIFLGSCKLFPWHFGPPATCEFMPDTMPEIWARWYIRMHAIQWKFVEYVRKMPHRTPEFKPHRISMYYIYTHVYVKNIAYMYRKCISMPERLRWMNICQKWWH